MTCDRTRHNKVSEDRRQLYASRQAWKIRRLQLAGMDSHAPGRLYDWQSTVMQAADFFTTGFPWSRPRFLAFLPDLDLRSGHKN